MYIFLFISLSAQAVSAAREGEIQAEQNTRATPPRSPRTPRATPRRRPHSPSPTPPRRPRSPIHGQPHKKRKKNADKVVRPLEHKHSIGYYQFPCWKVKNDDGDGWRTVDDTPIDPYAQGIFSGDSKPGKGADGRVPDSYVHRYHRDKVFKNTNPNHQHDIETEPNVGLAYQDIRMSENDVSSHLNRVAHWHEFERYILMLNPNHAYADFLRKCKDKEDNLHFQVPPVTLVVAFVRYLRGIGPQNSWDSKLHNDAPYPGWTVQMVFKQPDEPDIPIVDKDGRPVIGRNLCYNTIVRYKSVVVAVCKEHSAIAESSRPLLRLLEIYAEEDDVKSAHAFDVAVDLPNIHATIFSRPEWISREKVRIWAMFLFAMSFMCRASCLTTYCPLAENIKYPDDPGLWTDKIPDYVCIVWTDWKCRSKSKKGHEYRLKLIRNQANPRFCPVIWLLMYLTLYDIKSGPIFQRSDGCPLHPDFWYCVVNLIFDNTRRLENCTSHSIRRSSAQWAGRCRASHSAARNCGRWKSMDILAKYIAQGNEKRKGYRTTVDPVEKVWYFQDPTTGTDGGHDML